MEVRKHNAILSFHRTNVVPANPSSSRNNKQQHSLVFPSIAKTESQPSYFCNTFLTSTLCNYDMQSYHIPWLQFWCTSHTKQQQPSIHPIRSSQQSLPLFLAFREVMMAFERSTIMAAVADWLKWRRNLVGWLISFFFAVYLLCVLATFLAAILRYSSFWWIYNESTVVMRLLVVIFIHDRYDGN